MSCTNSAVQDIEVGEWVTSQYQLKIYCEDIDVQSFNEEALHMDEHLATECRPGSLSC